MTDALADAIRRAGKTGGPAFTHFLDPAARAEFLAAAGNAGLESGYNGGADDAERAVCACWAAGFGLEDWPVEAIALTWDRRAGELEHSDILGAVLGLGIKRESIGDVRLGEQEAWVAAEKSIASFILGNLEQAGRVAVRAELAKSPLPLPRGRERTVGVMSMRLDAVLAASLDMSRAKAREVVLSGKVSRNWHEETRPDREVSAGDMLSIRGRGRVKIGESTGISRKGRRHFVIETFLRD